MTETSTFDPERLRRVNALLAEALALPAHDWQAWLASLPPGQRDLLPVLAGLLARAEGETDAFMRRPVLPAVDEPGVADDPADAPGDQVGPYRLLRQLGAGGMGTVWLAERSDGLPQRRIALKLPHAGWGSALGHRMARERDILAALEHPRIARLYDAGITGSGRPWLAMEYVDGVPIDQFCRDRNLNVAQRLRLFLQVAEAVAAAHARLIAHRDLKPANILVTPQGEARLLDFGVAKLLEDEGADDPGATQLLGGRALTRDYASPEQIRGEPATVATDVYSLAVVLYELLTGSRPYRLRGRSAAALEEAIAEADVLPASQRAGDRTTARSLRGDLDTILAKAMQKDPAPRYASVDAMAADVQRHLDGLPVLARRASTTYRALKFLHRHRGPVAASVLVLLSLLGGIAGTLTQADRARHLAEQAQQARDQALRDLSGAEANESFLRYLLSEGAGRSFTTTQLLERADQVVDQQYATNPRLRARTQLLLANLFGEYRDYRHALAVLERAGAAAERSGDAPLLAAVQCSRASILGATGQPAQADALFAQAMARFGKHESDETAELVTCLLERASHRLRSERPQAAVDDAQEALRLIGSPRPTQMATVIALRDVIAAAEDGLGRTDRAVALYEATLEAAERAGQGGNSELTTLASNLGVLLARAGQVRRAVRAYERGLAVAAPATAVDHALLTNYARLLVDLGRPREALRLLERATAQSRVAGDQLFYGLGLFGIAAARCELREWRACEQGLGAARTALRPIVPRERALWGTIEVVAARASMARGDWRRARERLTQSLSLYRAARDRNTGRARALSLLARVDVELGELPAAKALARDAVAAAREAARGFANSEWLGSALLAQGLVLEAAGETQAARSVFGQALEQLQDALGEDAPATREARAHLGPSARTSI